MLGSSSHNPVYQWLSLESTIATPALYCLREVLRAAVSASGCEVRAPDWPVIGHQHLVTLMVVSTSLCTPHPASVPPLSLLLLWVGQLQSSGLHAEGQLPELAGQLEQLQAGDQQGSQLSEPQALGWLCQLPD